MQHFLSTLLSEPVRNWFQWTFPEGPTNAQRLALPSIAAGNHTLLISPTGTGKTLASFLSIIDQLLNDHINGNLKSCLRCIYVSPLRSLGYDIERNLQEPLEAIRERLDLPHCPIKIGVRTGDTSATQRRKHRDSPPHILITTPESLALLLAQANWAPHWMELTHIIIDEIHSLVTNKRGADLAISVERLSSQAKTDPIRIGLSATCRPSGTVASYLVGPQRSCKVVEAPRSEKHRPEFQIESLIHGDEAPSRALSYRRLLHRLDRALTNHQTTIIFANTRAFAEKLTHDLRALSELPPEAIAAHHSALDADRRREVESALKAGLLRAVITSTSLELGIDIGQADLAVLVGPPGSTTRCLQRVGRAGHRPGETSQGLLLAATPAELFSQIVTRNQARLGNHEPLRSIENPLDVLAQSLIGMACSGGGSIDAAFQLIQETHHFCKLSRADFDSCLAYLAGDLASPSGAYEPEPGAPPRSTSPRIWRANGRFGIRSRRVIRWFLSNVGTINSEESSRVIVNGTPIGTIESSYADRLLPGDRFLLDGRSLEFRRFERGTIHARAMPGDPELPRWTSDRQGLSSELAREVAIFRHLASTRLAEGMSSFREWLIGSENLSPISSGVIESLILAQERESIIPDQDTLLVEESPAEEFGRFTYSFHAPLGRASIEPLARAVGARLGRRFGQDLDMTIADLGWSLTLPPGIALGLNDLQLLTSSDNLFHDVFEGLDQGELLARRFRHVATTAMMVLKNPEGGKKRVGGLNWVSQRLYPLVKAASPDHPLLRETHRDVLNDLFDTSALLDWLSSKPKLILRNLSAPSPFTIAWIAPSPHEVIAIETAESALERLHARLVGPSKSGGE
jgi:ATP-dependent Lhr-like helicase